MAIAKRGIGLFASFAVFGLMSVSTGCESDTPSDELTAEVPCEPRCAGMACGDDGCGGVCGLCAPGQQCDAGACVFATPSCELACTDLNYQCGEHCGQVCGTCEQGESCVEHRCVCQADCRGKACGAADGCGGLCEPCPNTSTCEDCPLKLSLVRYEVDQGRKYAILALDYQPQKDAPLPLMADLRLKVQGDISLSEIGLGTVLMDAGKELFKDAATGRHFRALGDDTLQFLVTSPRSAKTIAAGRWLALRFLVDDGIETPQMPIQLSLVTRAKTLAPSAADVALWEADYGAPLVLWPWTEEGTHGP